MPERIKYRKWISTEAELEENYLAIYPNGLMLQISFENDGIYGEKCLIYQTKPLNPLDQKAFLKYKKVSTKKDFIKAQKKAEKLLKGLRQKELLK